MNSFLSLEPFVYPINGFLRFEVDDIETLGWEDRYSKSIKVGKSEWCIAIYMDPYNPTNNTECLQVYLKNLYKFEWRERVEAKFTFRLVHEDAQKTITKTGSEAVTYSQGNSGWRSRIPIENRERIINEGYVRNGRISVECDFEVESEKILYDELTFQESRPNDEDLKTMLSVVDFEEKKKTFEVELRMDEISENIIYSHNVYIDEVPCKIGVCRNNSYLRVYLYCNSDDESEWWGVEAAAEVKIKNRDDPTKILSNLFLPRIFSARSVDRTIRFNWDQVMKNGYVKYGRICIEATVYIRNKYGFDEKTGRGIEKTMKKMTDAVITVDTELFHISRMILSHHSPWFKELFHNDPEKTELDLPDVSRYYFNCFLQLAHNRTPCLEDQDSELFELVDKFGADECITRLDHQMIGINDWLDMEMLMLLDKYELPKIKAMKWSQITNRYNSLQPISV